MGRFAQIILLSISVVVGHRSSKLTRFFFPFFIELVLSFVLHGLGLSSTEAGWQAVEGTQAGEGGLFN